MNTQTIQRIIEIPLDEVRSLNYDANIKKYGHRDDNCLLCGKPIKNSDTAKSVHLLTNGNIVSYQSDDIEGSQGFFDVGSDCAKTLVIKFTF